MTNEEHEFLAPHEFLVMPQSARVTAKIGAEKLAEAKRLWVEADKAYWAAVELDKAARALASHGGQHD